MPLCFRTYISCVSISTSCVFFGSFSLSKMGLFSSLRTLGRYRYFTVVFFFFSYFFPVFGYACLHSSILLVPPPPLAPFFLRSYVYLCVCVCVYPVFGFLCLVSGIYLPGIYMYVSWVAFCFLSVSPSVSVSQYYLGGGRKTFRRIFMRRYVANSRRHLILFLVVSFFFSFGMSCIILLFAYFFRFFSSPSKPLGLLAYSSSNPVLVPRSCHYRAPRLVDYLLPPPFCFSLLFLGVYSSLLSIVVDVIQDENSQTSPHTLSLLFIRPYIQYGYLGDGSPQMGFKIPEFELFICLFFLNCLALLRPFATMPLFSCASLSEISFSFYNHFFCATVSFAFQVFPSYLSSTVPPPHLLLPPIFLFTVCPNTF